LRLEFKEKQDPSLIEKVIVLDDTPPQPANKKITRKSTQKISHVSTKAQIRVSSTKQRKVQVQRRVTRAMKTQEDAGDKLNTLAEATQSFM
jgi:hypothetical protein